MIMRISTVLGPVSALLILAGCTSNLVSPTRPEPIVKVAAALDQCGLTEAGIHGPNVTGDAFSPQLREEFGDIVVPPGRQTMVVALGQQKTAGYSLSLMEARWYGEATLNVSMLAQNPTSDGVTAQVITTPCVILDVPAEGWTQLRVTADLIGFPVAWVRKI